MPDKINSKLAAILYLGTKFAMWSPLQTATALVRVLFLFTCGIARVRKEKWSGHISYYNIVFL